MQTVKASVEIVSYVMGVPSSRVNMLARSLIDAGVLPKSSGRSIKKIDGQGLAALVAAVALADRGEDAPAVAQAIIDLKLEGIVEEARFGWMFGTFMTRENEDFPSVEFGKTQGGYACTFINNVDDRTMTVPYWDNRSWDGWVKRSVLIDASGIRIMRNLFVRDDVDGMVFKRA